MPAGVAHDSDGNIVVAATQSLRRYSAQTGRIMDVQHASIGDANAVATPLTVSSHGDQLLVSSWFSNTVQVWDPQAMDVSISYNDFSVPLNAVASGEDIVVVELGISRVVRRSAGTMDTEVLMEGLDVPAGLAAADGDLFVADWATGMMYQLMEDGTDLAAPGVILSGLVHPEGMALDGEGRLLVVETGTRSLLRIDPQGATLEVLAEDLAVGLEAGPGYPPCWLLSGVVVDSCGRITVSQDLDNSLLRIVPEPAFN